MGSEESPGRAERVIKRTGRASLESSQPMGEPWEKPPKALPDSVQPPLYPSRWAGPADAYSQQNNLNKAEKLS